MKGDRYQVIQSREEESRISTREGCMFLTGSLIMNVDVTKERPVVGLRLGVGISGRGDSVCKGWELSGSLTFWGENC